jgi:hypothetical protein
MHSDRFNGIAENSPQQQFEDNMTTILDLLGQICPVVEISTQMSEFPTLMSEFSASDKGFSALMSAFLTLTSHDLIVLQPHESCPSEQPQTPNPEPEV